jgi:hypothetical protein
MLHSSKLKLLAFVTSANVFNFFFFSNINYIPQFVSRAGIALETRALNFSTEVFFQETNHTRYIYLQGEPQSPEERCDEGRKEEVAPDRMLRLPDDEAGPKQGLQQVDRAEERLH